MTDGDSTPIYRPGDVVYGSDPFKGDEAARPWLVLSNHEGRPFHGEQYVALTLTTASWQNDLIEIPADAWVRGGTPERSRIVPWGIQSLDRNDVSHWQGRLDRAILDEAVEALIDELPESTPDAERDIDSER